MLSLSHRPTLITTSIVFWKIWNLFYEKCSSSSGTRTHGFFSNVFCPPRYPLEPWWMEDLAEIGWVLLLYNLFTGHAACYKVVGWVQVQANVKFGNSLWCQGCTIFFPRVILLCLYREPKPKNPEGPTPQAPNPINWKPQPQKPKIRPQPQTTINEQN